VIWLVVLGLVYALVLLVAVLIGKACDLGDEMERDDGDQW